MNIDFEIQRLYYNKKTRFLQLRTTENELIVAENVLYLRAKIVKPKFDQHDDQIHLSSSMDLKLAAYQENNYDNYYLHSTLIGTI